MLSTFVFFFRFFYHSHTTLEVKRNKVRDGEFALVAGKQHAVVTSPPPCTRRAGLLTWMSPIDWKTRSFIRIFVSTFPLKCMVI